TCLFYNYISWSNNSYAKKNKLHITCSINDSTPKTFTNSCNSQVKTLPAKKDWISDTDLTTNAERSNGVGSNLVSPARIRMAKKRCSTKRLNRHDCLLMFSIARSAIVWSSG